MAVSLLLALLVAQADDSIDEFLRPKRVDRVSRASGRSGPGLAFFEFAPTSGAGLSEVTAKPLPNWVTYSEQLNLWNLLSSAVAVPTVTANQATNPIDGALTADRVQVPATASTQGSWTYPATPLGTLLGVTTTCSIYIKGNGTSGTIDLCSDSPPACTACAYTSSAWSRCSVTNAPVSGGNVYFGNMSQVAYNGGVARSAQDVFAFGGMCNVGSTAAPYIATTTVARGYTVTGAKGEALTFSRTGVAYATNGTGGGLRTTNINNGDLVLMPSNQPRVVPDSAGTLGLLVESSRTNSLLRSQEITNAVWSKFSTATVPTPDTYVAPDGTQTADEVLVGASPTSTTTVQQGVGGTAGTAYTATVYLKASSGSGTVYLTLGNNVDFTTSPVSVACSVVSTSWTRCTATRTATGAGSTGVYIGSDPVTPRTIASGFNFVMWGAQLEAGAYATSYIPTTTASAVRNAETAYFAVSTPASSQSIAGTRTGPAISTGVQAIAITENIGSSTFGIGLYFSAGGRLALVGSPGTATLPAGGGAVSPARAWASWDGTTFTVNYNGTGTTSTPSPTMASRSAIYIGTDNATGHTEGVISAVCLDPSPTRCR